MTLAALLTNLIFFGGALAVMGFFGGLFIGRRAQADRVKPAMALWLVWPFLLIAIVVLREGDPVLSGAAAQANAGFATILYSLLLGGPFLLASRAGLAAGRGTRGPRP